MGKSTVLITGANGSIASSIVKKYLDKDYKVIAIDLANDTSKLEFKNNIDYEYFQADVTNKEQLYEIYEKIKNKYTKIDHLISTVGCPSKTEEHGIEQMKMEDIDKSILLNLNSHIYVTKIFLQLLKNNDSRNKSIVLISSVNGVRNFKIPLPAYSAAKAGIYGFIISIAKDLGKLGIRINAVTPGTVPSKENLEDFENYSNRHYKDTLALQDFTKPEDIADAVYSVTSVMRAVTGQNIIVDSGQTI